MSKRPPSTRISQKDLMEIYNIQQDTAETNRVANAKKKRLTDIGNALTEAVQKQHAEIEDGPVKPNISKIIRRCPRYKQETAALAERLGLNAEEYLEECRNRGHKVSYFRLKMKVVE